MNILIPVDGSPYSEAALAFMAARPFKDGHRPQIDLLNVQTPLPPRAGRAVGAEWARSWYESESRKILKPAVLTLQEGCLINTTKIPRDKTQNPIAECSLKKK